MDLENVIWNYADAGDPGAFAVVQTPTGLPQQGWRWAFKQCVVIGDVVAVAGKPAKGTLVARGMALNTSTASDPRPGRVIADFPRNALYDFALEILQDNGAQVGTLTGTMLGAGGPVPGAPSDFRAGNFIVTGGSGAFVGARGQAATRGISGPGRNASMTEDPAFRRLNGGDKWRITFQLISFAVPELIAAYHADFSAVTAAKPARAGEVLVFAVRGLGPTRPGLEPGSVFGSDPPAVAASPVEAVIGGTAAEVINQIGWPGTRDTYRVDVRMPSGIAAGTTPVKLTAAWITGGEFHLPVQ